MAGMSETTGHWHIARDEKKPDGRDSVFVINMGDGDMRIIDSGTRVFISGDVPSSEGYSTSWRVVGVTEERIPGDWRSRSVQIECTLGGRVIRGGETQDYHSGQVLLITAAELVSLMGEPPAEFDAAN